MLSAISSTLTRAAAIKSAAPTAPSSIVATSPLTVDIPPRFASGSQFSVCKISWTGIPDKDFDRYEVGISSSSGSTPSLADYTSRDTFIYRYTLSPTIGAFAWVRSRNRSGVVSAWVLCATNLNTVTLLPAGSISSQNADDVTTTGIKTGGGSATAKVLATNPIATVINLSGGSAYEDVNVSLTNRGFSTRPDMGVCDLEGVTTYKASYLANDSLSTSTNARVRVFRYDGANTSASSHILMMHLVELD